METNDGYEAHENIKIIKNEMGVEEIFYPVFYDDVPEKFKKYAKEKLNETDENKGKGIQKLRRFLEKENMPCPNDDLIVNVLRTCKYDIKKSESKLKRFLKVRQLIGEKLLKIDNEKIENIFNDMFVCILPYRDKNGCTILATRPVVNLDSYEADECIFCVLATALFAASLPISSICGICYIAEVETPNLWILYPIANAYRRYMRTVLDFPLRVSRVDFVNEIAIVRWSINVMKPFVGKIAQRINLNGPSYKEILKYYNPAIIPNDLGGNLGPMSNKYYKERLLDFIEHLRDEFR